MLDTFFIIGTILAFVFVLIGSKQSSAWGYFVALILFIVMGIGLLTSGWETHSNAPILVQDLNSSATIITFQITTYTADLYGTAVTQIIYVLGTFYVVIGTILAFLSMQIARENKIAKEE